MKASEICQSAAMLVGGDRAQQHGDKEKNFSNIAALWTAYLSIRAEPAAPLSAVDVGMMLAALKMARIHSGRLNMDDFIDLAGYAGCAGEIAAKL
jgi:hypothetical protein